MSFWTYILECSDKSYYVGHTDDLETRIAQHHAGDIPGYASSRRPVLLVYAAESSSRDDAFRLERKLKGWSRAKKQALIQGDFTRLKLLSKSKKRRHALPTLRQAQGERKQHNPYMPGHSPDLLTDEA